MKCVTETEVSGTDDMRGASPQKTPTEKKKLEDGPKPFPKRSKKMCKYGPKSYLTNSKCIEEFEHHCVSCYVRVHD